MPVPGGQWDSVLADYLAGLRDRPLWVSADADYHCGGSLAIATTMFYMREFTEAEVQVIRWLGIIDQETFVQIDYKKHHKPDDPKVLSNEAKRGFDRLEARNIITRNEKGRTYAINVSPERLEELLEEVGEA